MKIRLKSRTKSQPKHGAIKTASGRKPSNTSDLLKRKKMSLRRRKRPSPREAAKHRRQQQRADALRQAAIKRSPELLKSADAFLLDEKFGLKALCGSPAEFIDKVLGNEQVRKLDRTTRTLYRRVLAYGYAAYLHVEHSPDCEKLLDELARVLKVKRNARTDPVGLVLRKLINYDGVRQFISRDSKAIHKALDANVQPSKFSGYVQGRGGLAKMIGAKSQSTLPRPPGSAQELPESAERKSEITTAKLKFPQPLKPGEAALVVIRVQDRGEVVVDAMQKLPRSLDEAGLKKLLTASDNRSHQKVNLTARSTAAM